MTIVSKVPASQEGTVLLRRARPKYKIEFPITIEHVQFRVHAEGQDYESCIENAQFCIDIPDPCTFMEIGSLDQENFDSVCERIASEIVDADESRRE